MLFYVPVLLNTNQSNALQSLDQQCCSLLLGYDLQFMITALHIITITMKRIAIATAMERARKNGDEFSPHLLVVNVSLLFSHCVEVLGFASSKL